MQEEDNIKRQADGAAEALNDPDYPATKEYLRGVRDALDWVLEDGEPPIK